MSSDSKTNATPQPTDEKQERMSILSKLTLPSLKEAIVAARNRRGLRRYGEVPAGRMSRGKATAYILKHWDSIGPIAVHIAKGADKKAAKSLRECLKSFTARIMQFDTGLDVCQCILSRETDPRCDSSWEVYRYIPMRVTAITTSGDIICSRTKEDQGQGGEEKEQVLFRWSTAWHYFYDTRIGFKDIPGYKHGALMLLSEANPTIHNGDTDEECVKTLLDLTLDKICTNARIYTTEQISGLPLVFQAIVNKCAAITASKEGVQSTLEKKRKCPQPTKSKKAKINYDDSDDAYRPKK